MNTPMKQVSPTLSLPNPFPGLRPFREGEEYLFFGRESQVDAMVNKLAATRFLAVVGTSGSGKSSLVNCGLLPALHGGLMTHAGTAWRIAQFRPGTDPMQAMARALAEDGVLFRDYQTRGLTLAEIVDATLRMSKLGLIDIYEQANVGEDLNLLILVDQLEELFRYRQLGTGQQDNLYGVSEATAAFVNLLLEAKAQTTYPIYVVLTMRSDFLGDCAQLPGLAEAINAGQYLVPRMTRDERRAAIVGPVGVSGAEVSPVLLTRLVNDVGDNPDQLSILQHALNRTWACWQNESGGEGPLDLSHYEAIGTMAHALDQHAERAYAELGATRQQQICEKLFKALTDKATDSRGVRRPTTLGTLCALADATAAEVTDVIDVFRKPTRSFLMPPAGEALAAQTVIDISHESLMRVWQRLNSWADAEAQSAQTYCRLADTAALHAARKAGLWRDPDLQVALNWRDQSQPNETWASRYHPGFAAAMHFLTQSRVEEERRQAEEAERQRREFQAEADHLRAEDQEKAARRFKRVAFVAIGCAIAAVILFVFALRQYLSAAKERELSKAHWWAAAAFTSSDANDDRTALQLAERAFRLTQGSGAAGLPDVEDALRRAVRPEKNNLQLPGHTGPITNVAFSPNGEVLFSIGADGLRLWDVKSGEQVDFSSLRANCAPSSALQSSLDGGTLACANQFQAILWKVKALAAQYFIQPCTRSGSAQIPYWSSIRRFSLSFDGKLLALQNVCGNSSDVVEVWDVSTPYAPKLRRELPGRTNPIFSPKADRLATIYNKIVYVWDAATDRSIDIHNTNPVTAVAFNADGTLIAIGAGNELRFWDARSGKLLSTLHNYGIVSVAFSPDGKRIAAADAKCEIRVWDSVSARPLLIRSCEETSISQVLFSADSRKVLGIGITGRPIQIWDVNSGLSVSPLPAGVFALSPDGQIFAIAVNNTVELQDALTHKPLKWLGGGQIVAGTFSPDGKQVATIVDYGFGINSNSKIQVWDTKTRKVLPTFATVTGSYMPSISYSPDGKMLAIIAKEGFAEIRDASSGKKLQIFWPSSETVNKVVFSPNDQLVATLTPSDISFWDVSSGNKKAQIPEDEQLSGLVFTPDGQRIVTGSAIAFWDVKSAKKLFHVGSESPEVPLLFSPDGTYLVTNLKIWRNTAAEDSWIPFASKLASEGFQNAIFAPDGKQLAFLGRGSACGGRRSCLYLLNIEAGATEESLLRVPSSAVEAVKFSNDGTELTALANDSALYTFPTRIRDLLLRAKQNLVQQRPAQQPLQHGGGTLSGLLPISTCNLLHLEDADPCKASSLVEEALNDAQNDDLHKATLELKEASKADPMAHVDLGAAHTIIAYELFRGGLRLARQQGDVQGAARQFSDALQQDRSETRADLGSLSLDPMTAANKEAALYWCDLGYEKASRGNFEEAKLNIEAAKAMFQQALVLDPGLKFDAQTKAQEAVSARLLQEASASADNDITHALADFNEAIKLDPRLKELTQRQSQAGRTIGALTYHLNNLCWSASLQGYPAEGGTIGVLTADYLNNLCWSASLQGHAAEVMYACEDAVTSKPQDLSFRDSRGLALALTGHSQDAITDFDFFIQNTRDPGRKLERQHWVDTLRSGKPLSLTKSDKVHFMSE